MDSTTTDKNKMSSDSKPTEVEPVVIKPAIGVVNSGSNPVADSPFDKKKDDEDMTADNEQNTPNLESTTEESLLQGLVEMEPVVPQKNESNILQGIMNNDPSAKTAIQHSLLQKVGQHVSNIRQGIAQESFIAENRMCAMGSKVKVQDPTSQWHGKEGTVVKGDHSDLDKAHKVSIEGTSVIVPHKNLVPVK